MADEYKRRYFKMDSLIWVGIVVLVTLGLLSWFFLTIIKLYNGNGCVLDVVNLISQHYVFPMIALAAGIANLKLLRCDSDPMIIIKYASKRKLWAVQSICGLVTAMAVGGLVIISSMLYAYLMFGRFNNWGDTTSFFYQSLSSARHDTTVQMSPILILLCSWLITSLLIDLTFLIGLLAENLTRSTLIATLVIIILAGTDLFIPVFYRRLNMYTVTWTNESSCLEKIAIAAGIAVILFLVGIFIADRREYFEHEVK